MKTLLLVLTMALWAVGPTLAQGDDTPPAPKPEAPQEDGEKEGDKQDADKAKIDYLKPYRKQGNMWTIRTTSKIADTQIVSYTKYEIIEVSDDEATVKQTSLDEDREEVGSFEFKRSLGEANNPARPENERKSEESVRVPAGSFDCMKFVREADGSTTTEWINKADGLTVKLEFKTETTNRTVELTEHKVS